MLASHKVGQQYLYTRVPWYEAIVACYVDLKLLRLAPHITIPIGTQPYGYVEASLIDPLEYNHIPRTFIIRHSFLMRAAALSKSWRRPFPIPPNGSLTPFLFQTRTILDHPKLGRKPFDSSKRDAHAASRLASYGIGVMEALNVEPIEPKDEPKRLEKKAHLEKSRGIPMKKESVAEGETVKISSRTKRSPKAVLGQGSSNERPRGERSTKPPVALDDVASMPKARRLVNSTTSRALKPHDAPKETGDDVPFEGTSPNEPERPHKSTITRQEMEAFGRLFNMVVTPSGEYKPKIAKEGKLERPIFDAMEGESAEPKPVEIQDEDFPEHFPTPLKRMAAAASRKVQEKEEEARLARELEAQAAEKVARKKAEAERLASDPLYQQQVAQKDRIEALLATANTDVELWNVLETELFSPTQLLDLDSQDSDPQKNGSGSEGRRRRRESHEDNVAIITYIYPIVLRTALEHLTKSFPASSLPFSILPRIKRLGRTSYILGASTPLYNEIIYQTWKIYADFHRIDELLQEFDPAGLEFDSRTLVILEDIAREGEKNRRGRMGINTKMIWNMDVVSGEWKKVIEWIPAVRERLEEEAVRTAEEYTRSNEAIYEDKDKEEEVMVVQS